MPSRVQVPAYHALAGRRAATAGSGDSGMCPCALPLARAARTKLYVVAGALRRTAEVIAIPVSGACQFVRATGRNARGGDFCAGLLHSGARRSATDLDQVVAHCIQPATGVAREAMR